MTNIYWIRHAEPPRLAIVARPRGGTGLEEDLAALKSGGINVLVSLLTPPEAETMGLIEEKERARALGMRFVSYPIPDGTTPADLKSFRQLTLQLVNAIRSGESVGAHCLGCIGRSTVATAAVLIEMGWKADDALALIEQGRGCEVPGTVEQRIWIHRYWPERSSA